MSLIDCATSVPRDGATTSVAVLEVSLVEASAPLASRSGDKVA